MHHDICFSRAISSYDIALLHLQKNVTFNDYEQPAKLPAVGFQPSGNAVLTGFGHFDFNGTFVATVNVSLMNFQGIYTH